MAKEKKIPGKIIEKHTNRYIVNLSRRQARLFAIEGDWPEAKELLQTHRNFVQKGDVVECVAIDRVTLDYYGLKYEMNKLEVQKVIEL